MREYYVFLIQPDVANDYFGKEPLLFGLFKELNQASLEKYTIVQKQVDYITQQIPFFQIQQHLKKSFRNQDSLIIKRNIFEINVIARNGESGAILKVYDKHIFLQAEGNFEAETMFFEALRKYNTCFLALNYTQERIGWLNPIKQSHYVYKGS